MFKTKKANKLYTVTLYYSERDYTEKVTTDAAGVNGLMCWDGYSYTIITVEPA